MSGWGWFVLIVLVLVLAYAGFAGWRFWQARKRGDTLTIAQALNPFAKSPSSATNYPAPRSLGPLEWIKDKFDSMRNKRSTPSGYEESRGAEAGYDRLGGSGSGARGRGREDDAWDARVPSTRDDDPYGYHEETELGLGASGRGHARNNSDYLDANTGYGRPQDARGRSAQRDPFGDDNAASSMRSMSPRPADAVHEAGPGHTRGQSSLGSEEGNSSPISTRKSAFREGI